MPHRFLKLERKHLPDSARLAALVDVATTGLSCSRDRIVEFAGVLFAFDPDSGAVLAIVDEYTTLNDPGVPIPREATDGSRPTHQQPDGPRASTRFATRKFWGCIAIPFGGLALLTLMASLLD